MKKMTVRKNSDFSALARKKVETGHVRSSRKKITVLNSGKEYF